MISRRSDLYKNLRPSSKDAIGKRLALVPVGVEINDFGKILKIDGENLHVQVSDRVSRDQETNGFLGIRGKYAIFENRNGAPHIGKEFVLSNNKMGKIVSLADGILKTDSGFEIDLLKPELLYEYEGEKDLVMDIGTEDQTGSPYVDPQTLVGKSVYVNDPRNEDDIWNGSFTGRIVSYDPQTRLFNVADQDGDNYEMMRNQFDVD